MKTVSVAEFKRHFSEFVAQVRFRGERIVVARRDTPVAALVGLEDLERLSQSSTSNDSAPPRRGLLAAIGAWADYPEMDRLIEDIYAARDRAVDRPAPSFDE